MTGPAPSRYTRVGTSGPKGPDSLTDSFIQTIVAPIAAVASAAQQDTGVELPEHFKAISAFINVAVAEVTASVKTVDVGIFGGAETRFLDDTTVDSVNWHGSLNNTQTHNGGATVGFTLAGADFVELEGEIVIVGIGGRG